MMGSPFGVPLRHRGREGGSQAARKRQAKSPLTSSLYSSWRSRKPEFDLGPEPFAAMAWGLRRLARPTQLGHFGDLIALADRIDSMSQ
jgi:hypothetical protein